MPKQAEYSIQWSSEIQGYEIVHSPFSYPLLHPSTLELWLSRAKTFHFCSPTGETFTLRQEARQRGGGYWYAYKRVHGRVEKKYIGESCRVTLETLEALARYFTDLASSMSPPPPPPRPAPAPKSPPPEKPVLPRFTNTLASALLIYGFASVPGRKALIARYRELSKQHHPDTGGLHADMVTVNLTYDYLKKFLS